jgi:cobalt-precorrin-5B (C1)-methyltransferase
VTSAHTALDALERCKAAGVDLAPAVAAAARDAAQIALRQTPVTLDVVIVGRDGTILAHAA